MVAFVTTAAHTEHPLPFLVHTEVLVQACPADAIELLQYVVSRQEPTMLMLHRAAGDADRERSK
jgi:hypothetical protein